MADEKTQDPKTGKELQKVDPLMAVIEKRRDKIVLLLPQEMKGEIGRYMQQIQFALAKNPKLRECSETSIVQAVMEAAELGLDPTGGVIGGAYLVPYKGQAKLVPGYKGLIDLVHRAGVTAAVWADVAYEGDEFEYRRGTDLVIHHVPQGEDDSAKITHAYAVAKMKDGTINMEVLTRKQVDRIRASSPGRDLDPWKVHYAEMAKKTAIRRLVKHLPISSARASLLAMALERDLDNAPEGGETPEVPEQPKNKRAGQIKEMIRNQPEGDVVDGEFTAAPAEGATDTTGMQEPPDDVPLPTPPKK